MNETRLRIMKRMVTDWTYNSREEFSEAHVVDVPSAKRLCLVTGKRLGHRFNRRIGHGPRLRLRLRIRGRTGDLTRKRYLSFYEHNASSFP